MPVRAAKQARTQSAANGSSQKADIAYSPASNARVTASGMALASSQRHSSGAVRELVGLTAGPDFRPDASTSTVARRPKNQLAKPYEYKGGKTTLSTSPASKKPADRVLPRSAYLSFGLEEKLFSDLKPRELDPLSLPKLICAGIKPGHMPREHSGIGALNFLQYDPSRYSLSRRKMPFFR